MQANRGSEELSRQLQDLMNEHNQTRNKLENQVEELMVEKEEAVVAQKAQQTLAGAAPHSPYNDQDRDSKVRHILTDTL